MIGRSLSFIAALAGFCMLPGSGNARDYGQWEGTDPETRAWFRNLKQPDHPLVSCCGDADAYFADEYEIREGRVFARITDSRGNNVPVGTMVEVPPHKVNRDPNITGHIVIFLGGPPKDPFVYCYVPGSGT
ncbi:MAG: uncharacterized protein JWL62_2807 [Hyphomicrobiales bacterium]|nr:uncharacterized protein [Hyphomicrobiales bacterium]